ncbi:tape measure protein, partial [Hymenobacter agri]
MPSSILASVSVLVGAELGEFKAKMAEARKELKGLVQFSEGLKNIGTSLTTYVTAPLLALGGASLAASGKIESLKRGLEAITVQELGKQGVTGLQALQQSAALTTERMKELQVIAKQPGLGFEGAVQGDVRLRAVGISAEQSAKSIKAFANAIATTGGGKDEFNRVTVQLAQLSAKGKVLAQDLRPIIEAAPAVSGALQKLYGTVDSETISASLKKQGQSSTDFIAVLTDELAKLPQVQGGLKAIWENGLDALMLSAAKFGDGIAKAFNLQQVGQQLTDSITSLGDKFAALSPGVQKVIIVLGALTAATGPVLLGIGTLGAA